MQYLPQTSENYIIDGKYIYIYSDLFKFMPNVMNQVKSIHELSCGTDVSLCARNPCDTTLVIYVDADKGVNANELETTYYSKIHAFFTIEWYREKEFVEIYNVCTGTDIRRQGIMKDMLRRTLDNIPINFLWLGVAINNPIFDAVIHLYISVGFEPNQIVIRSPGGVNSIVPVLGMLFDKSSGISPPPDSNKILLLKNRVEALIQEYITRTDGPVFPYIQPPYIPTTPLYQQPTPLRSQIPFTLPSETCKVTFIILKELIKQIRKYYIEGQNTEYGGLMAPIAPTDQGTYVLGIANRIKGTEGPVYESQIPSSYITWHTHPLICYKDERCYIGWPSGQDMSIMITRFIQGPQIYHILYAYEAIYFIQLSIPMMRILKSIPHICSYYISQMVKYYFAHLEQYRSAANDEERVKCLYQFNDPSCLTYPSKQRRLSVRNMIQTINNATLGIIMNYGGDDSTVKYLIEQIKNCNIDPNVLIFKSMYQSMKSAMANGVVFDIEYLPITGSGCNIPKYNGGDVNYGLDDERRYIPQ